MLFRSVILTLSVLVWTLGKAGGWVISGGALRYLFIAAGWVMPWMRRQLTSTTRAKTVAILHMSALCVAVAPFVPRKASAAVAGLSLAALCWSFAVDVGRLWYVRATSTDVPA